MAYANLIAQACADRAEAFQRFRDFVCKRSGTYDYSTTGIGWTLHDAVYAVDEDNLTANDYFVIYSPGEGGDDDLYFKCLYKANYIYIQGYLYWNAATHAGVQAYNTSDNWNIVDAAVPILWIYGDLDSVLGIARQTSVHASFFPMEFGKTANHLYNSEIAICSGALSSGAGVTIDVGTVPASWFIGQKIFIRDTANIARITITDIPTSATITATLATNYLAGSKLSADVGYHCQGGSAITGNFHYFLISHDGTKGTGYAQPTRFTAAEMTEPLNGYYPLVPYTLLSSSYGQLGFLKDIYGVAAAATDLSTYTDPSGNDFRIFSLHSATKMAVKEV